MLVRLEYVYNNLVLLPFKFNLNLIYNFYSTAWFYYDGIVGICVVELANNEGIYFF